MERGSAQVWDPWIAEALAHADAYGVAEYVAAGVACQNSCRAPDLGFYPQHSCSSASFIC
jgi:hypothetical protein